MTSEKLAYYGKMTSKAYNALFTKQGLTIKEGVNQRLSKKALFINAVVSERDEVSLHTLNVLYANSKQLDKRGYFKSDDIISFEDLAKIQTATLKACAADDGDGLRLLDSTGNKCFLEVHRDKKTGSLSIAKTVFDPCLVTVNVISKEQQEKDNENKERAILEKLLKKYGNA